MRVGRTAVALVAATVAGQALSAAPPRQVVTGPVAVYWMSASTTSGMGGMGGGPGGGGGRPDARAMMAMAMGGGPDPNAASHSLILQLGSSRSPQGGPPAAEHDPPEGLGAGPVLPLLSPQPQAGSPHEDREPGPPPEYHQPHGRMLIFWGCGEHAGPGQPYVIDFATAANGGGAQFMALMRGMAVTPMQPPSPTRNTTYGDWPNRETRTQVGSNASLQGPHVVKGNYTPEMHFTLDASQDFLPPFHLTANDKLPSGANNLAWRPVDGARGYFATMIGGQGRGRDDADVVMWTSSAAQASAFGLPDYLSNREIARLASEHVLMPAEQTQCAIPAEAVNAVGRGGFFNLVAYGGESDMSWPPRPAAPQPWNIAWEAKLRRRGQTSGIVGMDMARMMGGGGGRGADRQTQDPDQPQKAPPKRRGMFPPVGIPHLPFP